MGFDLVRFMERAEWTELAACRGMSPNDFHLENVRPETRARKEAAARAVCRRCDVQAECLAFAMNNDERLGIWGGMTVPERRRLRARPLVSTTTN